jgi:ketosteroid isomerase-like protein
MFTPDGLVLPANAPVIRGHSELEALIESTAMTVQQHTIEFVDVDGYGDIAYARGTYSETYSVEGVSEPIADSGKILAVLRKQPDGLWLFSVWMWNSDLAPGPGEGEHSEGAAHN